MKNFKSFTLAEVLITLGIIGVVAALTIPTLIHKYTNKCVETRLKKIYSVMNQAIKLSEIDNGPKEQWNFASEEFIDTYFAPYLKILEIKVLENTNYDYASMYLSDGSLLITKHSDDKTREDGSSTGRNQDYFFYPNAKKFNEEDFVSRRCTGKTCFPFRFAPNVGDTSNGWQHYKKGFEPYKHAIKTDITEDILLNGSYGCKTGVTYPNYCTALIQYNNWVIPDDYPFKVEF